MYPGLSISDWGNLNWCIMGKYKNPCQEIVKNIQITNFNYFLG